jgi:NAD(P)H dehydrogenase (quinone)
VIAGSAGDGRISGATRADFAAAAAAVLTSDGHDGTAYELGGTPFTMAEFAAEVAAQSGKPVTYQSLPADAYTQMLLDAGLPVFGVGQCWRDPAGSPGAFEVGVAGLGET